MARPPSPNQILLAARAQRKAQREARRDAEMEIACQSLSTAADAARAAVEYAQWRAIQADRRTYLAERKRLREEEPTVLLAQAIELKKTALERAKYMAVCAEQERNMADLSDPEESARVQHAQTRADEAQREYKSLATIVSRRRKQVDIWLAKIEDARREARLSVCQTT